MEMEYSATANAANGTTAIAMTAIPPQDRVGVFRDGHRRLPKRNSARYGATATAASGATAIAAAVIPPSGGISILCDDYRRHRRSYSATGRDGTDILVDDDNK